ncbi:DUF4190 domain-containing protein [Nocardia thailandica]|uniref:DUF4190 domain-containing protein n=1 Tax=Nocardia thailandica TaxID=257275 RepID=UPI00030195E8|nr:DUF4190 domain-containing protein [Nocardia thailandica]
MTNPGDSDQWWKQYGGSGVSPESGSAPQYPTGQPSSYPSAPQQPTPPPSAPSYPAYPQQPAPSYPAQPQPQPYGATPYPAAPAYQPYGAYPQQPQGTNGLAIGSLVASLIGGCTCVGSIVGIVLGFMAMNQIKERGGEGKGLAIAGIVIGGITIVGWILYIVLMLILGASSSSTSY